jgi:hypothetical protein
VPTIYAFFINGVSAEDRTIDSTLNANRLFKIGVDSGKGERISKRLAFRTIVMSLDNTKTVDLTVCWLQATDFTLTKERAVRELRTHCCGE